MKRLFTNQLARLYAVGLCVLASVGLSAQITVTSTGGTASASYASLTKAGGAFAAINAGTHTGTITVSITADVTTEDGAVVLNASGVSSSSFTTITVTPSGARTISGSVATKPLIDLNGADNVTINGLNTGGNSLIISNTSTAVASLVSTIRFIADASTNTITNCTILGASTGGTGVTSGTIMFHTGTTTGNDNNTISNCNIGPVASGTLPSKAIYGSGTTTTTALNNSGNTITGCNIYDYFLASGSNAGLYLTTGNTAWTISNNKFYQTATRTSTAGMTHTAIYIANTTSADGFSISKPKNLKC